MRKNNFESFFKIFFQHKLFKNVMFYTIGDIISKVIPFLLLPVIAKFLTTADFGLFTNVNVLIQIGITIISLNTYTYLTVNYYKYSQDKIRNIFSNLFWVVSLLFFVVLFLVFAFNQVLQELLGVGLLWQVVAIFIAYFTSIFNLYLSLLRMQNRVALFNLMNIVNAFLLALFVLTFVVWFKFNWHGRVFGMFLGSFILFGLILIFLIKSGFLGREVENDSFKKILTYGYPLLPHTLSFWLKSGMDKIFLSNLISLSVNGIYSVALTLGSVVGVFTTAFFNAYSPIMYKNLTYIDELPSEQSFNIKVKLVKYTYIYIMTLLVVSFLSFFSLKLVVPILFTGDYVLSLKYIPFVLVTLFFEGIYSIFSGYIFYRHKTKVLGTITFSSSLLQMVLTYVSIRHYGFYGVVYSSCVISFITALIVFAYSNRLYRLPWFYFVK